MDLKKAQKKVDDWINLHGVRYFNELTNMAILSEEVGEVAKIIARKPKIFDSSKISSETPANAAIIAPTIITEEMAFVTDINGVCKEGVTLQTT